MQSLVVVSHSARACRRSKNCGDGGAPPPWNGGVALADTQETRSSHTCYHTKFRRSRSNRLVVGRIQKLWGAAADRPETRLFYYLCYCVKCGLVCLLLVLLCQVWSRLSTTCVTVSSVISSAKCGLVCLRQTTQASITEMSITEIHLNNQTTRVPPFNITVIATDTD